MIFISQLLYLILSISINLFRMKKRLTKNDRPIPIDEEIIIPKEEVLISVTDPKGIIIKANEVFAKVSGYSEEELVGSSHNVIRHPDMPKVMFKIIWEHIKDKENVMAVVKNLAKDGRYYWIVTDFITRVDANRNVIDYTAYRKPINNRVKKVVIPLYKVLCAIEEFDGMEASEIFLNDYFKKIGMSYDELIEEIIVNNCDIDILTLKNKPEENLKTMSKEKKRSFFNNFFGVK